MEHTICYIRTYVFEFFVGICHVLLPPHGHRLLLGHILCLAHTNIFGFHYIVRSLAFILSNYGHPLLYHLTTTLLTEEGYCRMELLCDLYSENLLVLHLIRLEGRSEINASISQINTGCNVN